jgi:hypothetical protein
MFIKRSRLLLTFPSAPTPTQIPNLHVNCAKMLHLAVERRELWKPSKKAVPHIAPCNWKRNPLVTRWRDILQIVLKLDYTKSGEKDADTALRSLSSRSYYSALINSENAPLEALESSLHGVF